MKKYNKVMMQTAELFAQQSYAKRRKVGAVLAKDGRILATGYNGTISGKINLCEEFSPYKNQELKKDDEIISCPACHNGKIQSEAMYSVEDKTCPYCEGMGKLVLHNKTNQFTVHAEQNIITYCAKRGISTDKSSLYITLSPCKDCAKLIVQSGIMNVYYKELYKKEGLKFLEECGVNTIQVK